MSGRLVDQRWNGWVYIMQCWSISSILQGITYLKDSNYDLCHEHTWSYLLSLFPFQSVWCSQLVQMSNFHFHSREQDILCRQHTRVEEIIKSSCVFSTFGHWKLHTNGCSSTSKQNLTFVICTKLSDELTTLIPCLKIPSSC